MGRFAQFLGDTEIEIAGQKLSLKATVRDMQKIMNLKDAPTENLVQLYDLVFDLMKRSYPKEDEVEMDAMVTKNVTAFLPELAIAWKWTTRDELNRSMDEARKKLPSQTTS
jgi:hypothetical protein